MEHLFFFLLKKKKLIYFLWNFTVQQSLTLITYFIQSGKKKKDEKFVNGSIFPTFKDK